MQCMILDFFFFSFFAIKCRGPAPADPGYSKERRRRRPIQMLIRDIKSNRMRIGQ